MPKKSLPKISIVTPSFNQAPFIRETIESVLNQDYPNVEYWVIDGGSTDGTVEILKEYDGKINWVSEKDKGQTDAINKGMAKVSGEIVAYLNSDDIYLPNTLSTVAEYFMEHPKAQWLSGDYFIIDEHGKKIQSLVAKYKQWLRKTPTIKYLSIANFLIQPSTFWRRSAAQEIGSFDESLRYCMDYDYWFRLMQQSPVHILPNHFSLFRIHGQSKGGSQYKKQFAEEHVVMSRYSDSLLLRLLHRLHTIAIVLVYKLIK